MHYIVKGAVAGVFGAAAVAAILVVNANGGWLPRLDLMPAISASIGLGAAAGWLLHFVSGALFGALLAWLDPDLPGDSLRQRGVVLAAVAWLPSMFFIMPLAGLGVFAMNGGALTVLALLALHLFFGGVTGSFYNWLLLQSVPLRYREVYDNSRDARAILTQGDLEPNFSDATLVPAPSATEAAIEQPKIEQPKRMPRAEPLLRLVSKDAAPESTPPEPDDARLMRDPRSRRSRF